MSFQITEEVKQEVYRRCLKNHYKIFEKKNAADKLLCYYYESQMLNLIKNKEFNNIEELEMEYSKVLNNKK